MRLFPIVIRCHSLLLLIEVGNMLVQTNTHTNLSMIKKILETVDKTIPTKLLIVLSETLKSGEKSTNFMEII